MSKYRKKPNLRTETVGDGLAVLDVGRNKPYVLNATSALVFQHCDGETTLEQLVELVRKKLNVTSSQARPLVWLSLAELDQHDLLEAGFTPTQAPQRMYTRREAMGALSTAGVSLALLPFIVPMSARADVSTTTEAWTTTTTTEEWTTTTTTEEWTTTTTTEEWTTTTTTQSTFQFTGWFPPVDNPFVVNSVKAGQSIPMKFSLNGDQGLGIIASGYPVSQQITGVDWVPVNEIEGTVSGSGLSYNAASDQYTYVWKTNAAWAGTWRRFTLRLVDGTERFALFKFK